MNDTSDVFIHNHVTADVTLSCDSPTYVYTYLTTGNGKQDDRVLAEVHRFLKEREDRRTVSNS